MTHKRRLLITGCPRSGTTFACETLRKVGFDIQHEKMGQHGTVDWRCSKVLKQYTFDVVLHQVREPLRVIESLYTTNTKSIGRFYSDVIYPINKEGSQLLLFMQWWFYWNKLCEQTAEWTYRVENMQKMFPSICMEAYSVIREWPSLSTIINSRRNNQEYEVPKLTWDMLRKEDKVLTEKIQQLAKKYGYARACIE